MKRHSVLFVLVALACNPVKEGTHVTDSTQVSADTATRMVTSVAQDAAPEVVPQEPSTIYPELIETPFTDDVRETAVVGPLFALLKQYDSDRYSALTSSYLLSYNEEVGPDNTEDVTENQTRTWYFDSLHRLKCYQLEYACNGTNGGHPPNMKTIYLFSNDSLIAAYVDETTGVYNSDKICTRAVAGLPNGGVVITEKRGKWVDSENYFELSEMDSSGLAKLSNTFFEEYRAVVQSLKKLKRPTDVDDPYTFTFARGTDDKTYSEEFMLEADLYNNIIAK